MNLYMIKNGGTARSRNTQESSLFIAADKPF